MKSLREVAKMFVTENPDFGKVDNANPNEQFAFEIRSFPAVFDVAEMTLESASSSIKGCDDFDRVVDRVPLNSTAFDGSFGFDEYGFDFTDECEDSISPGEFAWRISKHIVEKVFLNPSDFDLNFDPEELKDLLFNRFYYSASDEYWTVTFDSMSEQGAGHRP